MTISNVISGKPSRGLNKYMLEEVYFSESCFNEGTYNPQNARFVDGRYYYDLPDFWYNNLSNNKAIALRKIDLHAPSLNISFFVTVKRRLAGGSTGPANRTIPVSLTVQPNTSAYAILQQIARQVSSAIAPTGRGKFDPLPEKTIELEAMYDYATSTATLKMRRSYDTSGGETHYFAFEISNLNSDAERFFKKANAELPVYTEVSNQADGTSRYDFPGVWNREFLFVHASFVNGTSFNYLGRSGEFYPKPSKMYRFGGSSQQFYFELSFDGRTPVKDPFGTFTIDLAFIYHDKDYQAE